MSHMNPIPGIVRSTGLPRRVWPPARPQLLPLQGLNYTPSGGYKSMVRSMFGGELGKFSSFKISEGMVSAFRLLPAAQVLGLATLVRTAPGLTAMVSIAEAATVSMDDNYCALLWILIAAVEQAMASDMEGYLDFRGLYELSHEEYSLQQQEWFGQATVSPSSWKLEQASASPLLPQALQQSTSQNRSSQQKGFQQRIMQERFLDQRLSDQSVSDQSVSQQSVLQESVPQVLDEVKAEQRNYEEAEGTPSSVETASTGQYKPRTSRVEIKIIADEWYVFADENKPETGAFAFLADWLEARLSVKLGYFRQEWGPIRYLDLADDSLLLKAAKVPGAQQQKNAIGCWRTKILSGVILEITTGDDAQLANSTALQRFRSNDCLILTAAALWSLFDNALVRVPNCQCTFKTASSEFLQCSRRDEEWFVWHTFTEGLVCDGQDCNRNVRIALSPDEAGERLYTNTPCALGWLAESRHSPDSTVWTTLKVTAEFRSRTVTKHTVKEIQAMAQLSVPAILTPQLGGAVTFSKRYYQISNSTDHESVIAMERAAAAIVLIYDERRGLHLAFDGADIIEMCCVQLLKDIGCEIVPQFSHSSALSRLHTWYSSTFVSARHTYITGDHLVRQATKMVSELIEISRTAFKDDDKLLYWVLEDVLKGSAGKALKAPAFQHASWHQVASAAPPLILAVGDLNHRYLTKNGTALTWFSSTNKSPNSYSRVRGLSEVLRKGNTLGGIVASRDIVKRWFSQSDTYARFKIDCSSNKVRYGTDQHDAEGTYKACEVTDTTANPDYSSFPACFCMAEEGVERCLHYIE